MSNSVSPSTETETSFSTGGTEAEVGVLANGGVVVAGSRAFKVPSLPWHGGTRNGDGTKMNGDGMIDSKSSAGLRYLGGNGLPFSHFAPRHTEKGASEVRENGRSRNVRRGVKGRGARPEAALQGRENGNTVVELIAGLVHDRGLNCSAKGEGGGVGGGVSPALAEWVKHGSGDDSDDETSGSR